MTALVLNYKLPRWLHSCRFLTVSPFLVIESFATLWKNMRAARNLSGQSRLVILKYSTEILYQVPCAQINLQPSN